MDDVRAAEPPQLVSEGVRKLQLACLEHAVKCILHGGYVDDPQLFERDLQWIEGTYECHPGYSFQDICESVQIDARTIRNKLLQHAEQIRAGQAQRRRLGSVTRPRARRERVEVR